MIAPSDIAAITLRWNGRSQSLHTEGPDAAYVLRRVMDLSMHQPYLLGAMRALRGRTAFAPEDVQFRYAVAAVMDVEEEPWQGVEISTEREVEYVPELVFERLMVAGARLVLKESPWEGRRGLDATTRAEVERLIQEVEARGGANEHG